MLEWLTSATSIATVVTAVVFTWYGHWLGFSWARKVLIQRFARLGYIRYRTLDNGDIEILKINED